MADRGWDKILAGSVVFLTIVGVLMVFSASSYRALEQFNDSTYYLRQHLVKLLIALAAGAVAWRVDYRWFLRYSPLCLAVSIVLLAFVLVHGPTIKGSRRWIMLPFLQLQVSDMAKFALVLFFARTLPNVRERLGDFRRGLLPFLMMAGLIAALVKLEPDTGTAVLLFALAVLLLFLAGARVAHLVLICSIGLTLGAAHTLRHEYQRKRIIGYVQALRGEEVPYHTEQAVIGLGVGGLLGVGLGESKQKLYYLPEPFTDSIFAILGEELGFVGTSAVLAAYLLFMMRGLRIAIRAPSFEAYLLGVGLTAMVGLYALLNVAVMTGLVPATGIPLPFISYGGSNLLVNYAAAGLLLNLSGQARDSFAHYPTRLDYRWRIWRRLSGRDLRPWGRR
ncbi:MAG: FtsW/RodA/SpoVE family cell cycle protein [candidate division KSB1 bacterium]|nr:FtsW/RodA/SpoVE family cell cycle protein [candidate division KSB1 bacterium]